MHRLARLALAPGGRFVAYQVRDEVDRLGRSYFGPARVEVELLNIPPVRVFQWQKNGVAARSTAGASGAPDYPAPITTELPVARSGAPAPVRKKR